MIAVKFDSRAFAKELTNIVQYSEGFLEGIQLGKNQFLHNVGSAVLETMKSYIDSSARVNPQILHHVYEWSRTGSPDSRLYDIHYTVSNLGLSFKSTFSQSRSIKAGSNVPFYNKAKIMEEGIPVTIKPVKAEVLAFDVNGETVFTKNPVIVENPGGNTQGQFEKIFDEFFTKYFTQAFLRTSGIMEQLKNPIVYKSNINAGKMAGKSKGVETGYRWIANVKVVA
jgi:hypothetical protein